MKKIILVLLFLFSSLSAQVTIGGKGGTSTFNITNASDEVSTHENASNKIELKVYPDTTALKSAGATTAGMSVILKQLSSSNTNGGGIFVYADSATIVAAHSSSLGVPFGMGAVFFSSSTPGNIWVREDFLNDYYLNPKWFGAVPDVKTLAQSQINTAAIQNAIDFSEQNNAGRVVKIPEGVFWIAASNPGSSFCLDLKSGIKIIGTGFKYGINTGSILSLYDNQNCTVFANSTLEAAGALWHWGEIRDLMINCNATNNSTKAQAIDLYKSGELTYIQYVGIRDYRGSAITLRGAHAPLSMNNIVFNPGSSPSLNPYDEERIAVKLVGTSGKINLKNFSGDNNIPFFLIRESSPTLLIDGLKVESANTNAYADTDSSMVFWMDSLDGNTVTVEINNLKMDVEEVESVFRITQGSIAVAKKPNILLQNAFLTGMDAFLIEESATPDTVIVPSQVVPWYFYGGNAGNFLYLDNGLFRFEDANSGIVFNDNSNNFDGFIKHQSDNVLHIRGANNAILLEKDDGTDLFKADNAGNISYKSLTLNSGLKIGASSQIDSLQYKSSGDSLQIYINGVGWKAFKLNSSSGN